jgi:DNA-binding NtrC family response regulator
MPRFDKELRNELAELGLCSKRSHLMSGGPRAKRIAVLVVDDEPLVRMDLAEVLQHAGFEVEEASCADEALKKLNGGGYCLGALVTDVQMPGAMNGYGLANRVHDLFPNAIIVVISGVVRPSPGEMPPNATFLPKPVNPGRLVDAINDALAGPEYQSK